MKRFLFMALMAVLLTIPPAWATELIAPNYANNSARTKGEMKQFYEDVVSLLKEDLGGAGTTAVTLASDTFAVANNTYAFIITSQTGSADALNTATANTRDGRIILLRAATGHVITIAHLAGGSGQFFMQDATGLAITDKTWVAFYYNEANTRWEEVWRDSIRTPGGAARTTLTLDTNGFATPTGFSHLVDTFAAAASDNADRLVTTNKVPLVLVRQANASRFVTLRHNQGGDGTLNHLDGQNITFTSTLQAVLYERNGTTYDEVARFGFSNSTQYEAKTATFTAEYGHFYGITPGSATTMNLPTAANHVGERIEFIVYPTANNFTIDPFGSEPINGNTAQPQGTIVSFAPAYYQMISIGTGWIMPPVTKSLMHGGTGIWSNGIPNMHSWSGAPDVCQVRMTLTAGDPWGRADAASVGTLRMEPVLAGHVAMNTLQSSANNIQILHMGAVVTVSLTGLNTSQPYRAYLYDNNSDGLLDTIELVAWTNATTPPVDDTVGHGAMIFVKMADKRRRAIGDIMLTGSGTMSWNQNHRGICHLHHNMRAPAPIAILPATNSWAVADNTALREIQGAHTLGETYCNVLSNSREASGADGVYIEASVEYRYSQNGSGTGASVLPGIGINANTNSAQIRGTGKTLSNGDMHSGRAEMRTVLNAVRLNDIRILEAEISSGTSNATGYGDTNVDGSAIQCGLIGTAWL